MTTPSTPARVEGTLDPLLAAEIAKAIAAEFYLMRSVFEPCHLDDDDAETALREIILRTANASVRGGAAAPCPGRSVGQESKGGEG